MQIVLKVSVPGLTDADLDRETGALIDDLRDAGSEKLDRATEPAPPGTRGMDAQLVDTIVASVSPGMLGMTIAVVRDWLRRRDRGAGEVELTVEGDTLKVEAANSEQQADLIGAFLARHGPGG